MPIYKLKCKNDHVTEKLLSLEEGENPFTWDDCSVCGQPLSEKMPTLYNHKYKEKDG